MKASACGGRVIGYPSTANSNNNHVEHIPISELYTNAELNLSIQCPPQDVYLFLISYTVTDVTDVRNGSETAEACLNVVRRPCSE